MPTLYGHSSKKEKGNGYPLKRCCRWLIPGVALPLFKNTSALHSGKTSKTTLTPEGERAISLLAIREIEVGVGDRQKLKSP